MEPPSILPGLALFNGRYRTDWECERLLDLNRFRLARFIAFLRRAIEHAWGTTDSIPIHAF